MADNDGVIIKCNPADLVEPMVQKLQSLHGEKTLCDVTLRTGDYTADAHKVILALGSDYFKAMFSGNWSESFGREIVLNDMTPNGLKAVIEYIYCGKFYLSYDYENLAGIISALHHCQLNLALKLCEKHLKKKVNDSNFVELFHISDTFNLYKLRKIVGNFVVKNYMPSFTERYNGIKGLILETDPKLFKFVLFHWYESSKTFGFGPFVGMRCAVEWAEHKHSEREQYLLNLLSHFAGRELDAAEVNELVEFCKNPNTLKPEEKPEENVLVNNICGDLACFDMKSHSWTTLPKCPHADDVYKCWGTAVVQNILYVCGGLGTKTPDGTSAECNSYDPYLNHWFPISPLLKPRRSLGLVGLRGKLLALGGMTVDYDIEDSVEMYDQSSNTWSMVQPLPLPVTGHAAVTYKDKVYITGGFNREDEIGMTWVYCYDPATKTWCKKADMIQGRLLHSMVAHEDHLYVLGGETDSDELHSSNADEPFVESYSIEADTWTAVELVQRPNEFSLTLDVCSDGVSLFAIMTGWFSQEEHRTVERNSEKAVQVASINTETKKFTKIFLSTLREDDDDTEETDGTECSLDLFHPLYIPTCVMKYMSLFHGFDQKENAIV